MKKVFCVILAIMMTAVGVFCMAEGETETVESGFTDLLMIREGAAADVYQNPGDESAMDTLEAGRLCIKIEETTAEENMWYHVFYVGSENEKKGVIGFIHAEDAEALSESQLSELMQDPDKANEIADLIDALNNSLETNALIAGSSSSGNADTADSGESSANYMDQLSGLYDTVMGALKKVYETDVSAELNKVTEAGNEIRGRILEAGKDVVDSVASGVTDAYNNVKDSAAEFAEKMPENVKDTVNDLKDSAAEFAEKLPENVKDTVSNLKDNAAEFAEKLPDNVKDTVNNLKDSAAEFAEKMPENVKDTVNDLKEKTEELTKKLSGGVTDTLESLKNNETVKQAEQLISGISDLAPSMTDELGIVMESAQTDISDAAENLRSSLESETGTAMESLNNMMEKARTFLTKDAAQIAQDITQGISNGYTDSGLQESINNAVQMVRDYLNPGKSE